MTSLPTEFKERMKSFLGSEYEDFLSAYENPPYSGFRANLLKITPEELLTIFPHSKGGVPWCPSGFYYDGGFGSHPCHKAGLFYSQEPSAMIAAELLDVQKGDIILDLCAAPGGKSTQIASKLQGSGLLVSNEIVKSRSLILRENIERMGVSNSVVTNMSPEKMETLFPSFFNKILVDAPCSGEGMFRKDPKAIDCWSTEHTVSCAARQLLILGSASKMLAENGVIVYSTCTFSEEENQKTIERFLSSHPDFVCEKAHLLLPHKVKGEGHFAARLVKKGGETIKRTPLVKEADPSLFRAFEKDYLNTHLEGKFISFADTLYLLPTDFGDINGVKLTLPGLCLGEIKKTRFEPSHHLCMALKAGDFKNTHFLSDAEADAYFLGNVVAANSPDGWGAMLWHSYPVGWYKASNNTLKNHYPKKLRNMKG